MQPRILLLQARRANDPVKTEERHSFADKASLPPEAFTSHDLLQGPPSMVVAGQYDAVMIGGSGEYYISKGNLPHLQDTLAFFADLVHAGHPVFASCFGFHLMTTALGGEVIYDAEHMELGTYDISLTEAGQADELFSNLPVRFKAQLGRQDRAAVLPTGTQCLAYSELSPYQAFRIPGKPIWATQFHPELSCKENTLRYKRYLEGYSAVLTSDERARAFDRFRDSPFPSTLIPKFLDLIS